MSSIQNPRSSAPQAISARLGESAETPHFRAPEDRFGRVAHWPSNPYHYVPTHFEAWLNSTYQVDANAALDGAPTNYRSDSWANRRFLMAPQQIDIDSAAAINALFEKGAAQIRLLRPPFAFAPLPEWLLDKGIIRIRFAEIMRVFSPYVAHVAGQMTLDLAQSGHFDSADHLHFVFQLPPGANLFSTATSAAFAARALETPADELAPEVVLNLLACCIDWQSYSFNDNGTLDFAFNVADSDDVRVRITLQPAGLLAPSFVDLRDAGLVTFIDGKPSMFQAPHPEVLALLKKYNLAYFNNHYVPNGLMELVAARHRHGPMVILQPNLISHYCAQAAACGQLAAAVASLLYDPEIAQLLPETIPADAEGIAYLASPEGVQDLRRLITSVFPLASASIVQQLQEDARLLAPHLRDAIWEITAPLVVHQNNLLKHWLTQHRNAPAIESSVEAEAAELLAPDLDLNSTVQIAQVVASLVQHVEAQDDLVARAETLLKEYKHNSRDPEKLREARAYLTAHMGRLVGVQATASKSYIDLLVQQRQVNRVLIATQARNLSEDARKLLSYELDLLYSSADLRLSAHHAYKNAAHFSSIHSEDELRNIALCVMYHLCLPEAVDSLAQLLQCYQQDRARVGSLAENAHYIPLFVSLAKALHPKNSVLVPLLNNLSLDKSLTRDVQLSHIEQLRLLSQHCDARSPAAAEFLHAAERLSHHYDIHAGTEQAAISAIESLYYKLQQSVKYAFAADKLAKRDASIKKEFLSLIEMTLRPDQIQVVLNLLHQLAASLSVTDNQPDATKFYLDITHRGSARSVFLAACHRALAELAYVADDHQAVVKHCTMALSLSPNDIAPRRLRAMSNRTLEQLGAAIADYEKVVEVDSNCRAALLELHIEARNLARIRELFDLLTAPDVSSLRYSELLPRCYLFLEAARVTHQIQQGSDWRPRPLVDDAAIYSQAALELAINFVKDTRSDRRDTVDQLIPALTACPPLLSHWIAKLPQLCENDTELHYFAWLIIDIATESGKGKLANTLVFRRVGLTMADSLQNALSKDERFAIQSLTMLVFILRRLTQLWPQDAAMWEAWTPALALCVDKVREADPVIMKMHKDTLQHVLALAEGKYSGPAILSDIAQFCATWLNHFKN